MPLLHQCLRDRYTELLFLIRGLRDSLWSVFWIAVLLFVLVFVSAVFVTSVIGQDTEGFEDPEFIMDCFGTVRRSMETLAIFLTLCDWSEPARLVNEQYPFMAVFWVWYIVMGAFLILSLLTGLMADKMKQVRERAENEDQLKVRELFDRVRNALRVEFEPEQGAVDFARFQEIVKIEAVAEVFKRCGMEVQERSDCLWVFHSIDRDGNGKLSWEEFEQAVIQISRQVRPSESQWEMMWMETTVEKLDRMLAPDRQGDRSKGGAGSEDETASWDSRLDLIHARASLLRERLHILEHDVRDFCQRWASSPASTRARADFFPGGGAGCDC